LFCCILLNSIEGTLKIVKSNRIINTKKKFLSVDKCDFDYSQGEKSFDDDNTFEDDFHYNSTNLNKYHNCDTFWNNSFFVLMMKKVSLKVVKTQLVDILMRIQKK